MISPVLGSSAPVSQALIVVRILSIAGVEFASSRCISASLCHLEDILQISAGRNHSFAGGSAGDGPACSESNPESEPRHFATPGSCLPGERRSCHTVPVDSNGTVAPQGKNGYGQLGDCSALTHWQDPVREHHRPAFQAQFYPKRSRQKS